VGLRRNLRSEEVEQVYERGSRLLVKSVESFLAGTYEDHLCANNQIIPVWARLNSLAHGDLGSINEMAKHADPFDLLTLAWDVEAWMAARSTLARDLVRLVQGRAALLIQVQRRILIPIESVLMEQEDVTAPELVLVTRAALRAVRA
jgi:hypothetical protein